MDYIEEIQTEQQALDAARHWPDGTVNGR